MKLPPNFFQLEYRIGHLIRKRHGRGIYICWQGPRFTTGKSGKCPACRHRTVCWNHHCVVSGYANFIIRIRKELNLDLVTGKNQL